MDEVLQFKAFNYPNNFSSFLIDKVFWLVFAKKSRASVSYFELDDK